MKILKYRKELYGVRHALFTIIFDAKKSRRYHYYLNAVGTKNTGGCLIYKSRTRLNVLNRYSLIALGLFYTFYVYSIKWPLAIILVFPYMYLDGGLNFIKDSAWQNNARFFNWVNIVAVLVLLSVLLFRILSV